jgi:hypothetical protein
VGDGCRGAPGARGRKSSSACSRPRRYDAEGRSSCGTRQLMLRTEEVALDACSAGRRVRRRARWTSRAAAARGERAAGTWAHGQRRRRHPRRTLRWRRCWTRAREQSSRPGVPADHRRSHARRKSVRAPAGGCLITPPLFRGGGLSRELTQRCRIFALTSGPTVLVLPVERRARQTAGCRHFASVELVSRNAHGPTRRRSSCEDSKARRQS